MKIGIINNETWAFFNEVYVALKQHHTVSLFKHRETSSPLFRERINRTIFRQDLDKFLRSNEVVFFEWASELLAIATHLPKTCVIVTRLHRYEMYQWVDQINWQNVDRIIFVSEAKKREFTARFPEHSEKAVVIPESIDLTRFQPRHKPYNRDLGILCHLTPRKRVYELILAFAGQGMVQHGYRLHIGGGEHPRFKDYYQALVDLVQKLELQDRVLFHGPIADPRAFYREIDIFISNSYNEGLQVSPMEAIASGCYCLSHWWSGAEELLPKEDLFLTEGEMWSAIAGYDHLDDQQRFSKREHQRQRVIDRFDAAKISQRILALVEDAARIADR